MSVNTDLKLAKIIAPLLSSAEFGKNVREQFANINRNFEILANRDFVKGETGESVKIVPIHLGMDLPEENQDLKKEILDSIKLSIVESYESTECAPIYYINDNDEAIELNWLDNLVTKDSIIYLIYKNDQIISSLPYTFLDKRFNDGFGKNYIKNNIKKNGVYTKITEAEAYEDKTDLSCVIYVDLDENEDWKTFRANSWPQLYYDVNILDFCWKYQNILTGIPARGPQGKDAETIQNMFIVKVKGNTTESSRPITHIMTPEGTFERLNDYLNKYKNNGWPRIIGGSTAVVFEYDTASSLNTNKKYWISIINTPEDLTDSTKYYVYCAAETSINNLFNENSFIEIMKRINPLNNVKGFFMPIEPSGSSQISEDFPAHCIFSSKGESNNYNNLNIASLNNYNKLNTGAYEILTDANLNIWNNTSFKEGLTINKNFSALDNILIVDKDENSNNYIKLNTEVYIDGINGYLKTDKTIDKTHSLQEFLLKSGSSIGKSQNGGEIFNDYINNLAAENSHAEGANTLALGKASHAEGEHTLANGDYSHAEGYSSDNISFKPYVKDINENIITLRLNEVNKSYLNIGDVIKISFEKNNWIYVINDIEWTDDDLGIYTLNLIVPKEIKNKTISIYKYSLAALGNGSHAEGYNTYAIGKGSHAEGIFNYPGVYSDAFLSTVGIGSSSINRKNALAISNEGEVFVYDINGYKGKIAHKEMSLLNKINKLPGEIITYIDSDKRVMIGERFNNYKLNSAIGNYSHAEGNNTQSPGDDGSHAEGANTLASGQSSHAEGNNTRATGKYAHAEGYKAGAENESTHAEGNNTRATGKYAHAEGSGTYAKGIGSHAEGYISTSGLENPNPDIIGPSSYNKGSHAEGIDTRAIGDASHAEGNETYAGAWVLSWDNQITWKEPAYESLNKHFIIGDYSHTEGQGTRALNIAEHAEGLWNYSIKNEDSIGSIHTIGIGTDNSNRKNAVTVLNNGEIYIKGIGGYEGNLINNTHKSLATAMQTINKLINTNKGSSNKPIYIYNGNAEEITSLNFNELKDSVNIDARNITLISEKGNTRLGAATSSITNLEALGNTQIKGKIYILGIHGYNGDISSNNDFASQWNKVVDNFNNIPLATYDSIGGMKLGYELEPGQLNSLGISTYNFPVGIKDEGKNKDKAYAQIPMADDDVPGVMKIGYVQDNNKYPIELSADGKAYAKINYADNKLAGVIQTSNSSSVVMGNVLKCYLKEENNIGATWIPIAHSNYGLIKSDTGGNKVSSTGINAVLKINEAGTGYIELPAAGVGILGLIRSGNPTPDALDGRYYLTTDTGGAYTSINTVNIARKLECDLIGSDSLPVYFIDGKPIPCKKVEAYTAKSLDNLDVGDTSTPAYFSNGKPVICTNVKAVSAESLGAISVGSGTLPVYFSNGKPVACSVIDTASYAMKSGMAINADKANEASLAREATHAKNADNATKATVAATAAVADTATFAETSRQFTANINVGDANTPVYFSNGNPVACSGTVTAAKSADYAEMFEWNDGNPNQEDRIGYFVSINNGNIEKANGNDILGVVSAQPMVLGNNPFEWPHKYITDEWGRDSKELNPDYDESKKYIRRSERPEWSPVGLLGQLRVRLDGSLKVNEYCSAKDGIATYDKNGKVKVLKIFSNKIALVLIK